MKGKKLILFVTAFVVCFMAAGFGIHLNAAGSNKLDVGMINYETSTITFISGSNDKVLYISANGKTAWEEVPGGFTGSVATMDISWIPVTSNYKLYFKGDVSNTVALVTLPKQNTSLKVKYVPSGTKPFSFTGAGSRTIQFRKEGVDTFSAWNGSITNDDLSYLKGNGATLYFRLAPEIGTGTNATGYRPGKEVAVKIPAKKDGPSISVNVNNYTVPLTSKMAYRVCDIDSNGNVLSDGVKWVSVSSTKSYSLVNIAPACMLSGTGNSVAKSVAIQFKSMASSSAQESRISTVIIPAQKETPNLTESGVNLAYTSSTTFDLKIKAAGSESKYEYAVVIPDDYVPGTFDYDDTTWTSVSNSKAVSFTKKKVPAGSHIFIRKAAVGAYGDDDYAMAAKEIEVTGKDGVVYPTAMSASGVTNLSAYAGMINGGDYGTTKEFTLYSYSKTTVQSVSFKDIFGNEVGDVSISSSVAKNKNGSGDNAYIITTKIVSTENLDSNINAIDTKLYATITLENGEKIVSSDTTGVTLTLYPQSKVVTPPAKDKSSFGKYFNDYTTNFARVYLSSETDDKASFKFLVDFGTRNNGEANDGIKIGSMIYDGYILNVKELTASSNFDAAEESAYGSSNADAYVAYENYENEDGEEARRAYVTVHADKFEANAAITKIGVAVPFIIKLSNGETLSNSVYMTLLKTATLNAEPIAWTITEGELSETTTVTSYDDNGNKVSTDTTVVNDFALLLTKMNNEYSVSVSDVTWNGTSILYNAVVSGDQIAIYLSNAKLNTLSSGGSGSTTANVVISFSNGYKINTGCKLTILKKVAGTK